MAIITRRNLCTIPRATSTISTATWAYSAGTAASGSAATATQSVLASGAGAPFGVDSCRRAVQTVSATSASAGPYHHLALAGIEGDTRVIGMSIRSSRTVSGVTYFRFYNGNTSVTSVGLATTLPAGEWVELYRPIVATAAYTAVRCWFVPAAGVHLPQAGDVYDWTAGFVEQAETFVGYFDGASVVFGSETTWEGAAHSSVSRMRTFVPDVIRTQADVPPLRLEVFDKAFTPQGPIGDPAYVTAIPRHNEPGQISFAIPGNHHRVDELVRGGAHVRVIDELDAHVLSGWVSGYRVTGPERSSLIDFNVMDHLAVLRYILGWVVPTGAITAQGTAGTNWSMDGPAETVLKAALQQNGVARLGLPITVPATQGRGAAVKGRLRMQPLYDRLFPTLDGAGIADSGVGFDMRLVPRQGLVLDTYVPRTIPQVLNEESGAITEWGYNYTAPTATRGVAGGQGEGQLRLFREKALPALEAEIGWKREIWRDARDTNDPTTMYERIDESLKEGAAKAGLSVTLAQTGFLRYGTGVRKGDIVSLAVGGQTVTDRLSEATLSWTKGSGFEVRPRVGEKNDSADSKLIKLIQQITRSIQNRNTST